MKANLNNQQIISNVELRMIENGFWNLMFSVAILYIVTDWIIPNIGDTENLKFTRFGLICEIIGLVSLAPDYFGDAIKKLDLPKDNMAKSAGEQREKFERFLNTFDGSVFYPRQSRYLSYLHFMTKLIICGVVGYLSFLRGYNFFGDNSVLFWLPPTLELLCSVWIGLGIINFIFEKLHWILPINIRNTYLFSEFILALPLYVPTRLVISLFNYILSGLTSTEKIPFETLLLKLTIPFVIIGTLLELYATFG
jgi:hypothetical protein